MCSAIAAYATCKRAVRELCAPWVSLAARKWDVVALARGGNGDSDTDRTDEHTAQRIRCHAQGGKAPVRFCKPPVGIVSGTAEARNTRS